MALAILEYITSENGHVKFNIDTGTNEFYYLKIGSSLRERNGINWVDGIIAKTSLQKNEKSKNLFNSSKDISLPSKIFKNENCYVQLFSFKNKEGKSPAFSEVLKVPIGLMNEIPEPGLFALSTSINEIAMRTTNFNPQRNIPYQEYLGYSRQASIEDILASVVRIAGPIVMGLLSGIQNNSPAGGTTATAPAIPQLGMLNTILNALLQGTASAAPTAAVTPVVPAVPTSVAHSLSQSYSGNNRFASNGIPQLSNQFIFGIDDALLATIAGPLISNIAGPVLQLLPQLINSANQSKLQNRQATNKLVTDLVAETNRRMMLQQFLQNQQASGSSAAAGGINLNQLLQLLQQLPAADAAVVAPVAAAPIAATIPVAQSLSYTNYASVLSTKTILSFESAAGITFNGKECAAYNKSVNIKLKLKLNVVEPAPKKALPKAIVRLVFKDNKNNTLSEKTFRQKDVMPNTILEFDFSALELRSIPSNMPIQVIAEMKWLTSQNREVKTLGNSEIVFVENSFVKEQGKEQVEEKELSDMKVYRSFWNKIWESPVLDKINSDQDGVKKYSWELNANVKYSFALSPDHTSNGLMETKKLTAEKDSESLTEKTEGRIKAGIELSLTELNKLCSLWDKQPLLSPEKLNAFRTLSFANNNANEFIYNIKLKGKANERGMVWIVPVLKLINFSLSTIKTTNDSGQITEVIDEQVQLPLPVSARILGLKTA